MKPTYIIFDATGIINQQKSNYGALRSLSAWQHSFPDRFKFNDLEDVLFCATHSELEESRIWTYLQKKMDESDNVLILASENLKVTSSILNKQVDYAVRKNIPVIVTYVGLDRLNSDSIDACVSWLPTNLKKAQKEGLKIVHIPFTMDKIERACKNFSKERAMYGLTGKTIY